MKMYTQEELRDILGTLVVVAGNNAADTYDGEGAFAINYEHEMGVGVLLHRKAPFSTAVIVFVCSELSAVSAGYSNNPSMHDGFKDALEIAIEDGAEQMHHKMVGTTLSEEEIKGYGCSVGLMSGAIQTTIDFLYSKIYEHKIFKSIGAGGRLGGLADLIFGSEEDFQDALREEEPDLNELDLSSISISDLFDDDEETIH